MAWDLSVLKRALPELEAVALSSSRLAEGFRSQQDSLVKGRVDNDLALQEARAALQQSREEAAALRLRNSDLEREIGALRRASAIDVSDFAPKTPQTGKPPRPGGPAALTPLSPLLSGLKEEPGASRGSAYWRRARMCLKIASIADYWQTQSLKTGGPHMGTPIPGHMAQIGGGAIGGTPLPAGANGEGGGAALPPRLAALTRKVESAITEGVASAYLRFCLEESALDESGSPVADAAAKQNAKKYSEAQKAEAAKKAASAAAAKAVAAASADSSAVPASEKPQWQSTLQSLQSGATSSAACSEALSRAPQWASSIEKSVSVVIDQNMPPLTAHLHTILKDGIAAAVRSLQSKAASGGAAADEAAAAAKGLGVMNTLSAAVDNVRQQFVVGLRSSVPPATASQLGKPLMDALCELAVEERCARLRKLTTREEITSRVWEEVAIVQDFVSNVSKTGPQPWLQQLLAQSTRVTLPEPLAAYIETHISNHLDPYIDGDITSPEEERGTSPMFKLLCEAYERDHGRELPAPPEVVLALYVKHGICKANATQCFTDLVMGQGRLPIPGAPQEKHCEALGRALQAAIEKDFGPTHTKIQGVPISAALIESLAKEHSSMLFVDHQKNAERLAEANRLGEIGRKEEMKRIFGIDI